MLNNFLATYGYSILVGITLFIAAWFLASWADKAIGKMLSRNRHLDSTTTPLIARTIRITILVLAGVLVLDEFGIDVGTLIAALSIFGFAIAIGMRPTSTNFFTGVMLFILKPYRIGEYIEGERVTGIVEALRLFHTVVVTAEGTYVSVPNGAMWSKSIKNFSRSRPVRVALDIAVEHQLPFSEIGPVIDRVLRAEPKRKAEIDPHVMIVDSAANSMSIQTAVWCDAEHSWEVRTTLSEKLREGITAAGATVTKIEVPKEAKPKTKAGPTPSNDEDA